MLHNAERPTDQNMCIDHLRQLSRAGLPWLSFLITPRLVQSIARVVKDPRHAQHQHQRQTASHRYTASYEDRTATSSSSSSRLLPYTPNYAGMCTTNFDYFMDQERTTILLLFFLT